MSKLDLTGACKPLNDIFASAAEREEQRRAANGRRIIPIPIDTIDDFPGHPFHVRDDEDMQQLAESIRENGVLTPVTVMRTENDRYRMISGHRRKHAAEVEGLTEIPAEIVELTHEEAVVRMVESNLQRTEILPSELAFAYKMRNDAMKRTAGRRKKNGAPVEPDFPEKRSSQKVAAENGTSAAQVKRYIRLTALIPELLDMVDTKKLAFRTAVTLSYLTKKEQKMLLACMTRLQTVPGMAQAEQLRTFSGEKQLTEENMLAALGGRRKPAGSLRLPRERFARYFPADTTPEEMADTIEKALQLWAEQNA